MLLLCINQITVWSKEKEVYLTTAQLAHLMWIPPLYMQVNWVLHIVLELHVNSANDV
jgi:hypothetical protein